MRIDEVGKFEYLRYTLQRDECQETQVRKKVKRAAAVMEQVWEIRKRRFGKD